MDIRKSDLSRHNSEIGKSHGAKDSLLYKKICSKTFFIYKTSENEKKLLTGLHFLYAFHENLYQGLRPYTQTTFSPENLKGKLSGRCSSSDPSPSARGRVGAVTHRPVPRGPPTEPDQGDKNSFPQFTLKEEVSIFQIEHLLGT